MTEHQIDIILYVLDVWLNDNEGHRLAEEVEAIYEQLERCDNVVLD